MFKDKIEEVLEVYHTFRRHITGDAAPAAAATLTQVYFDEIERDFVHEQNENKIEAAG